MQKNRRKLVLKSQVIFDKKIAMSFSKTRYYKAMADYNKNVMPKRKEIMKQFSTTKKEKVTILLEHWNKESTKALFKPVWKIPLGIYRKRLKFFAENGANARTDKVRDLMSLLAHPYFLVSCYRQVRKNKGAMTKAAMPSRKQMEKTPTEQRTFLDRTYYLPTGLSRELLATTSKLLKQGKYPWGTSRRIYIRKPGQPNVGRPLTIPPFMDRVVQEGIRRILESIYEPIFEKMNRSFGFRPHKGCHDAIYGLTRMVNAGLTTAIEGDVKSAYDKVDKKLLIKILSEEIADSKFLDLMKKRLNYTYLDGKESKYVTEKEGIPQGGIDSPYLWNIYKLKFDRYVDTYLTDYCEKKNNLKRANWGDRSVNPSKEFRKLKENQKPLKEKVKMLNSGEPMSNRHWNFCMERTGLNLDNNPDNYKEMKYALIKQIRIMNHKTRTMHYERAKTKRLRFYYTRYADDWIILGNFTKEMAQEIKENLAVFLKEELRATLSEEKTLITDMKVKPAHFLGFELYVRNKWKLGHVTVTLRNGKQKRLLRKANSLHIVTAPDRQRLISRLHMKGFCDSKGFPKEMGWITGLEGYTIIERYNAILRGLANYYAEWVRYPSTLQRWFYIIRYSCFKTLAQKYSTTIRGIFKKFGKETNSQITVEIPVRNWIENKSWVKYYTLLTAEEAIKLALDSGNKRLVETRFELIENDKDYPTKCIYHTGKGGVPRVMDDNFLNKMVYVTMRTRAQLDLPCTICGELNRIHMHHIEGVRTRTFGSLKDAPIERLQYLRNRKQLTVCEKCHITKIHKGVYMGPNLSLLAPDHQFTGRGYDNRIALPEIYIGPNGHNVDPKKYAKSLEQKGWIQE